MTEMSGCAFAKLKTATTSYICTHVDDFKIVARDPMRWMKQIEFVFVLKDVGEPSYYLGNNYYKLMELGCYAMGCKTYIKECI